MLPWTFAPERLSCSARSHRLGPPAPREAVALCLLAALPTTCLACPCLALGKSVLSSASYFSFSQQLMLLILDNLVQVGERFTQSAGYLDQRHLRPSEGEERKRDKKDAGERSINMAWQSRINMPSVQRGSFARDSWRRGGMRGAHGQLIPSPRVARSIRNDSMGHTALKTLGQDKASHSRSLVLKLRVGTQTCRSVVDIQFGMRKRWWEENKHCSGSFVKLRSFWRVASHPPPSRECLPFQGPRGNIYHSVQAVSQDQNFLGRPLLRPFQCIIFRNVFNSDFFCT